MQPDPNAALRALVGDLEPAAGTYRLVRPNPTGQPSSSAGTDPEGQHLSPCPASNPVDDEIQPGAIACWWHGSAIQVGVIQNVGADGRVWLRRLDQPRQAIPQPAEALGVLWTLNDLRSHASDYLTDQAAS